MKKKISKEELEDILHAEKVEALWESINTDELDKKEKDREWYRNYTKKQYHPDSYIIKKELDKWEVEAPVFQEFEKIKDNVSTLGLIWASAFFIFGLVMLKALLL